MVTPAERLIRAGGKAWRLDASHRPAEPRRSLLGRLIDLIDGFAFEREEAEDRRHRRMADHWREGFDA